MLAACLLGGIASRDQGKVQAKNGVDCNTYGNEHHHLTGFTDADGSSQEHHHAISGYAFLIDGGAVSWASKKQELITLSIAESEYIAATHAAKECIWL